ncbi:MAG: hypothetical protein JO170_08870, partial [Verrucomicrobia bacterium]|nr:hypothetical protein [Verrucomicrobiota bacterium]
LLETKRRKQSGAPKYGATEAEIREEIKTQKNPTPPNLHEVLTQLCIKQVLKADVEEEQTRYSVRD